MSRECNAIDCSDSLMAKQSHHQLFNWSIYRYVIYVQHHICGLSERATFLTHIVGNEMLTYLKMYAFWYDTATEIYLSYTLLHYCWPKKCYYAICIILITFLSCMQSLMRIKTTIRKMMFLDYRTRHICCIRTS